ncbi:7897_t:CDS:2, partial [Gigaspora margarita]
TVYQYKHLARQSFMIKNLHKINQSFNKNKLQSESDHSISLSDNDDKESNEESQLTDLESEQKEVIVHHIINSKGKWKLETLFINTLDAPTFIGDLKI